MKKPIVKYLLLGFKEDIPLNPELSPIHETYLTFNTRVANSKLIDTEYLDDRVTYLLLDDGEVLAFPTETIPMIFNKLGYLNKEKK
jgi:hypothetical protein